MPSFKVVITDTTVLINLIHIDRLELLGRLPPFEFLVADEVAAEITNSAQMPMLNAAFGAGSIQKVTFTDLDTLTLTAELRRSLGLGEAVSLAAAVTQGWLIACDEKRAFSREARTRLGEARMLSTPGILLLAIRNGIISVEEADELKKLLEQRRFRMTFGSFRELL